MLHPVIWLCPSVFLTVLSLLWNCLLQRNNITFSLFLLFTKPWMLHLNSFLFWVGYFYWVNWNCIMLETLSESFKSGNPKYLLYQETKWKTFLNTEFLKFLNILFRFLGQLKNSITGLWEWCGGELHSHAFEPITSPPFQTFLPSKYSVSNSTYTHMTVTQTITQPKWQL